MQIGNAASSCWTGRGKQPLKALKAGFVAMALLAASLLAPLTAQATYTLDNLREPLPVQLQDVTLHPLQIEADTPVSFVVPEDVRYRDWIIPEGTVLRGHVTDTRVSKRFFKPGYVAVQIEAVDFPASDDITLAQTRHTDYHIYNPHAKHLGGTIMRSLPVAAVKLATSITLSQTTDMNKGVIYAFVLGAGVLTGVAQELIDPEYPDTTAGKKVAYGAFRGTGLSAITSPLHKSPNPSYAAGEFLLFPLTHSHYRQILEAANPGADIPK